MNALSVFVVLEDAMGGDVYSGTHRTRPEGQTGKRVLNSTAVGEQSDPHVVYIAQIYDRTMDVHRFAGVYGNYEAARSASGPKGSTLTVNI